MKLRAASPTPNTKQGKTAATSWIHGLVAMVMVVAGLSLGLLAPAGAREASPGGGAGGTDGFAATTSKRTLPSGSTATSYPAGSLIIDMGVAPQTVGNALKPYGFVYELLTTYKVPVAWDIAAGKTSGTAADFTATGLTDLGTNAAVASRTFSGSAFVISGSFVGDIPAARITYWLSQGVKIYRANSGLTGIPQFSQLRSWPRIVLDAASGDTASKYYGAAGIPQAAYREALPSALTACDDLFVFPHADPTWALHNNLKNFNNAGGYIFGQCHAPSVLENIDNPGDADTLPDLNFLTTTGLVDYGAHKDGTPPYTYQSDWSDPIMQMVNPIDDATTNGSEQILLPKIGGGWRPTTKVLGWDPDQVNLIGGTGTDLSPGKAAVQVYGRGFGNPTNGLVMYQGGHDFSGNGLAEIAAQRAFLNFNMLAGIDRGVDVTSTVPTGQITGGTTIPVSASATGGSGVYTYQWTSSCGGTFANSTAASTTFTAPSVPASTACTIRVTVTDSCGRVAFSATSVPVEPTPPPAPSIAMTKSVVDASGDGKAQLGETLTYSFSVTNTGNVPLTNVRISDAKLGVSNVVCAATLAVGATATCPTKTYIVTAADITAGKVDNSAIGTATPPPGAGGDVTATGTATIQAPAVPGISLLKTVADDPSDGDTFGSLGETLTYTFKVTNTGNVPLTNVTITDTKLGMSAVACVPTLAVGATATCPSKTYLVSATDVGNGSVVNNATTAGTPPSGPAVTSGAQATIATQSNSPAISLAKAVSDASGDGKAQLGETLTYTFSVTNTGNVPLSNVTITDAKLGMSGVACVANLAVGETKPCATSKTYTVLPVDIAAGKVDNTASAAAVPATGGSVSGSASATITAPAVPAIKLVKTVADQSGDGIGALNETLTYTFTVTNTGNVPLSNVTISDTKLSMTNVVCGSGPLSPGDSRVCPTKTYSVSAGDVASGSVVNSATVSGTPPSGPEVTGTGSVTIATQSNAPALHLAKTVVDASGDGLGALGETLTYTFTVTNSGNVPVSGVVINDAKLGLVDAACGTGTLAVGATRVCPTGTYVVTAGDIANGQVTNTATASGTPSTGGSVTSNDAVTIVTPAVPGLSLVKTVADAPGDGDSIGSLNETLTYTFTVKNTGNVPLTDVTITDAKLSMTNVACVATLAVGETKTCPTRTYTVQAADVVTGSVTNTATAKGTPPTGGPTTGTGTATIATQTNQPAITMVKTVADSADAGTTGQLGETLTYTFTVTNTGNVPLANVTITDAKLGMTNVACVANLGVGETKVCPTRTYTVLAADIAAGKVDNTATAKAAPTTGGTVQDDDSATIDTPATPAISVDKSVADSADADTTAGLGEQLTYTFSVTNTGNVPLTDVTLTDAKLGLSGVACVANLAVGESKTCSAATYAVLAADVADGSVDNTASVSAKPSTGGPNVGGSDTATIPTEGAVPRIKVVKSVVDSNDADALASQGETLTYTFTVTNNGNVDLTDVTITDAKLGMTDVACVANLAQGETKTCPTKDYTVSGTDVAAGQVDNTATVKGKTPANATVTNQGSTSIPTERPAMVMTKSVSEANSSDNLATEGELLTYSFTVTNTGNVPLTNVRLTDAKLGLNGALCVATLAVGATTSCPSLPATTHVVTAAEVAAGTVANTATTQATTAGGVDVQATASASVQAGTPVVDPANLSIDKSVDVTSAAPGSTVTYTLTVRNTGPGSAANVRVTDALPAGTTFVSASAPCTQASGTVTCDLGTLASGETSTLTIKVKVDPVPSGDTTHQHQLDYTKVESHLSAFDDDTKTVSAQCPAGYLATDGSVRVDHVDQGTGTLADAVVLASGVTADGRGWTGTVRNDATGQVQAKVNVVCMTEQTSSGEDHAHPVVVSAPVTASQALPAGRTSVDVTCGPGTWAIAPSFAFTSGDGVVGTRRTAPGTWRFTIDARSDAPAAIDLAVSCLSGTLGEAAGHSHDLVLREITGHVDVPAGQVVEVRLTCEGDEKGIVAWTDLAPGLVGLGTDPQPVTRVYRFFNPTGGTLSADYGLLCVDIRTAGGSGTAPGATITNTAHVSTTSVDSTAVDNSDSASFQVNTSGVTAAPRVGVVTQGSRTQMVVALQSATKGKASVTLRTVGKAAGLKSGTVLAKDTTSLRKGRIQLKLDATGKAGKAVRSGKVKTAELVIVVGGQRVVIQVSLR